MIDRLLNKKHSSYVMAIVILLGLSIMFSYFGLERWTILFLGDKKHALIAKEWNAKMGVIVIVIGIVTGKKIGTTQHNSENL